MKISIEIDQDDLDQMNLNSSDFVDAIKRQLLDSVVGDGGEIGEDWLPNIDLNVYFKDVCIHHENIITNDEEDA
jgi:multidrug efflux pump subunit AcrB